MTMTGPTWAGTSAELPDDREALVAAVAELAPVTLEAVQASASLLTRVDRKYFVPTSLIGDVLAGLSEDFGVLEIAGRRLSSYRSTYLDSEDLLTYRQHLQGRRRRYKVRVRSYLETDVTMLEVKVKGRRGVTEKHRTPHAAEHPCVLAADGRLFVERVVGETYGLTVPSGLVPSVVTSNRRATLVAPAHHARITCDVDLAFRDGRGSGSMSAGTVLLETKSGPNGSPADAVLRRFGLRPARMSKYCVGVALLHPQLTSNPWHPVLRRYFDAPAPHRLSSS